MASLAEDLVSIFRQRCVNNNGLPGYLSGAMQHDLMVIMLSTSAVFALFHGIIAASRDFDWDSYPTIIAFTKQAPMLIGELLGAMSLRDWTWLGETNHKNQRQLTPESEKLIGETAKFPKAFAVWLCEQNSGRALVVERLSEGALSAIEHVKFAVDHPGLIHMMDSLALIRSYVVEIQSGVPMTEADRCQFYAAGSSNP